VDQKLGLLILLTSHHWMFSWGTVNGIVYQDVTTSENMWQCIIDEFSAMEPQVTE
jgi:hypothetical protein